MVKLSTTPKENIKEMRSHFSETLTKLARENDKVAFLSADVVGTLGLSGFFKEFGGRAINVGIAEANMMGMAAGMSVVGMVPFVNSFGPFATRRCYDQIYMSGSYAKANVKIIGSDPGVTATFNGGTHMPFDDIALMRIIPEMTVYEPADGVSLEWCMNEAAKSYGMYYIRLPRKTKSSIYDSETTFEKGKALTIKDGTDLTIIASGIMVAEALKAADILAEQSINARVLDMFSIKPIDKDAIIKVANETGAILTCENHTILGGLGSAVAEVVVANCPVPMTMVGVEDRFGQVGPEDFLMEEYGLTAANIALKAKALFGSKA